MFTLLLALTLAQPIGPTADWKFEILELKNGSRQKGLVIEESPIGIRFVWIRRQPGRAIVTLTSTYEPSEVAAIEHLPDAERALLKERLEELEVARGGERSRIDSLNLQTVDWPGRPMGGKQYVSEQFVLVSDAPEEITRRAAVRLEQIYTAYALLLPPRSPRGKPIQIYLAADREGYQKLLGDSARSVLNPAVYIANENRIICGTELRSLDIELARTRLRSAQQLADLNKYETTISKLYKDSRAERDRFLQAAAEQRRRIWIADTKNGERFDQETRQLFPLLYHETFHAYVHSFVHPQQTPEEIRSGNATGELPRWLDEGLAQIFETAILDGLELRVGHADRNRLQRVQDLLKNKQELTPLATLLRSNADSFVAAHNDQKGASNRSYLTSWALAFHLTFERKLIGTPAFHKYLVDINTGGNPITAFETLVGSELPAFEKEFHLYLLRLQYNGTVKKP